MKLKGKYGISWVLTRLQEPLFYFYMFDVPFFSAFKVFGIKQAASVDFANSKHICVKGLIVALMTAESLVSHSVGPTATRVKKKKPDNHIDVSKAPFKSPLRQNREEPVEKAPAPQDDGIGLFNK